MAGTKREVSITCWTVIFKYQNYISEKESVMLSAVSPLVGIGLEQWPSIGVLWCVDVCMCGRAVCVCLGGQVAPL